MLEVTLERLVSSFCTPPNGNCSVSLWLVRCIYCISTSYLLLVCTRGWQLLVTVGKKWTTSVRFCQSSNVYNTVHTNPVWLTAEIRNGQWLCKYCSLHPPRSQSLSPPVCPGITHRHRHTDIDKSETAHSQGTTCRKLACCFKIVNSSQTLGLWIVATGENTTNAVL